MHSILALSTRIPKPNLALNDLELFSSKHINELKLFGHVAQMVERSLCMREAWGAIPCICKANY